MTVALTVNGSTFQYPEVGDSTWGVQATNWASAVTSGMLQKAGGAFTLTAEVDFGSSFGLKSLYVESQASDAASAGAFRLGNAENIAWRNNADSGDLNLTVNSSDLLEYNGTAVSVAPIPFSDMAALTASRALELDGSGEITASSVTATELGYLSGLSQNLQTSLDAKLSLAGGAMTGSLTLAADPTSATEAATKSYVDITASGFVMKEACRVATTTAGTLASDFENGDTVDGVVLAANDRILIKDQASAAENGIYTVNASGAPTRGTDMDAWDETVGALVFITAGTANANTNWTSQTEAGGTLGVTDIPFVQYNAPGTYTADGEGIELVSTEFQLELDGTTLSKSASGLTVASGGITNTEINASAAIALSKLATTTANRALVSDAGGLIVPATTTDTEIGYINGLTSSAQTQLDSKIAASLFTAANSLIYSTGASTAAELVAGTDGYALRSNSGVPTWTDREVSYTVFQSNSSSAITLGTSFASFSMFSPTYSQGTAWGQSGNTLTPAFTGLHRITISLSLVFEFSGVKRFMARLRNTTDNTTVAVSGVDARGAEDYRGISAMTMIANITDVAKNYEIQFACTGSNVSINRYTIDSEDSLLWLFEIEKIPE